MSLFSNLFSRKERFDYEISFSAKEVVLILLQEAANQGRVPAGVTFKDFELKADRNSETITISFSNK